MSDFLHKQGNLQLISWFEGCYKDGMVMYMCQNTLTFKFNFRCVTRFSLSKPTSKCYYKEKLRRWCLSSNMQNPFGFKIELIFWSKFSSFAYSFNFIFKLFARYANEKVSNERWSLIWKRALIRAFLEYNINKFIKYEACIACFLKV